MKITKSLYVITVAGMFAIGNNIAWSSEKFGIYYEPYRFTPKLHENFDSYRQKYGDTPKLLSEKCFDHVCANNALLNQIINGEHIHDIDGFLKTHGINSVRDIDRQFDINGLNNNPCKRDICLALGFGNSPEIVRKASIRFIMSLVEPLLVDPRTNRRDLVLEGSLNERDFDLLIEMIKNQIPLFSLNIRQGCFDKSQLERLWKALDINASIELLNLDLENCDLDDTDVANLGAFLERSKRWLKTLKITGSNITDVGAKSIIKALENKKELKVLDLSYNKIGDDGIANISEALKYKELEMLALTHNNITDKGVENICPALGSIKELKLDSNYITPDGATILARALMGNKTLTNLYLGYNEIGWKRQKSDPERDESYGVWALSFILNATNITTLGLAGNGIKAKGAECLSDALSHNDQLQELDLSSNDLGAEGAFALGQALRTNKSLKRLYLSGNGIKEQISETKTKDSLTGKDVTVSTKEITDKGLREILLALWNYNRTLEVLIIGNNGLDDNDIIRISKVLKANPILKELKLEGNNIGATKKNLEELREALKENKSLKVLDLGFNRLGDDGIKILCEGLNTSLDQLKVFGNGIGDDGASAICEALRNNRTLQVLILRFNNISDNGAMNLVQTLKSRHIPAVLGLGCNKIENKQELFEVCNNEKIKLILD